MQMAEYIDGYLYDFAQSFRVLSVMAWADNRSKGPQKDPAKKSNFYITIPHSLLYLLMSLQVPFPPSTAPAIQLVKVPHPGCRS